MVRVVVGFTDHEVQERPLFGIQDLVRLEHHLPVLTDHAPCPAVSMPPPWLEVIGHFFHLINHYQYREVLVNIYTFWLG